MFIENEQFITVKQLAEILNVSKSLIYKYIQSEKFYKDLYVRLGSKKILFKVSKLDEYLFPEKTNALMEMQKLMLDTFINFSLHPPIDPSR